jgi:hypothetical protein
MVENMTQNHTIEGLNPAGIERATNGTQRKELEKNIS